MQLRISLAAATLITSMAVQAEDYVSLQYLQYNESDSRTAVSAPSVMINKDFGTDYTLNANFVADAVSGASETYYDADSGASAFSRGIGVNASDVTYGNVEYEDTRVAGGATLITRFDNRDELTVGLNYSSEHDFYSAEGSLEYMHWLTSSKNNSLSLGVSYQSNRVLVHCGEDGEDTCDADSGASQEMTNDAINAQISYFQNINSESYAKVALFYVGDSGYLSNPYSNVVKNYNGTTADVVGENRPDNRTAYGLSLKYANAITDSLSAHIGYRYYTDDWDIDSHTLDTDFYYEVSSDWLVKLGLRYYMQSEANFYSAKKDYFTSADEFASSDIRLGKFNALTYKADVEYKVTDDFNVNFGVNYYDQSTNYSESQGIDATYIMTGVTYKF